MPGHKWSLEVASEKLELPDFQLPICYFLYDQTYPNAWVPSSQVSIDVCPVFKSRIAVFYGASATFCAPSDPSGSHGMHCEFIQATPSWQKGHAWYDYIFTKMQPKSTGQMQGLNLLVFSSSSQWSTGIHFTHVLLSNHSLLLVMGQIIKQVFGW